MPDELYDRENVERGLDLLEILILLVVIVGGAVYLLFIPEVDKINIHLDDDIGIAPESGVIPTDLVLLYDRKAMGKRIPLDWFCCLCDVMRGRELPLTLHIAGRKFTVIVNFCDDRVPGLMWVRRRAVGYKFNPTSDSWGLLFEDEGVGAFGSTALPGADYVRDDRRDDCHHYTHGIHANPLQSFKGMIPQHDSPVENQADLVPDRLRPIKARSRG